MATVNLGSIKFKWKGTYSGATAYTVDDVVSYNGSSYICILASTGNLPTNATYFEQMAQAGTNGTNGTDLTTTLTTQGDILYRDGSGLQRLAKGTASKVLAMNSGATAPEWVTASGGTVLKVYQKMWGGSKSLSGNVSSMTLVNDYVTSEIFPISNSSKFVIQWTIAGNSSDHHFFKVRRNIGGTRTDIGQGRTTFSNDGTAMDTSSFAHFNQTNSYPVKTLQYYDEPATTSGVTYELWYTAHGTTFYFGRSHHNPTEKQYFTQNACTVWELDGSKAVFQYDSGN